MPKCPDGRGDGYVPWYASDGRRVPPPPNLDAIDIDTNELCARMDNKHYTGKAYFLSRRRKEPVKP